MKHFFFDVDGTLTPSKSQIDEEMRDLLWELQKKGDIILVSGSTLSQMRKQVPDVAEASWYQMGQSGNHCIAGKDKYWYRTITPAMTRVCKKHAQKLKNALSELEPLISDPNDLIEERGAQVSYSLIGHHADPRLKASLDPHGVWRKTLLSLYPLNLKTVTATVGGTTCIDYTKKNSTKGDNVRRLINRKNWNREECVYFGDALYKGGNDYSVREFAGVVTVEVDSPEDTKYYVRQLLNEEDLSPRPKENN